MKENRIEQSENLYCNLYILNLMALHQKLYLIFSEHTLFTLVRENQQISDFCTSLGRKPYCLSSTCCGEEPPAF